MPDTSTEFTEPTTECPCCTNEGCTPEQCQEKKCENCGCSNSTTDTSPSTVVEDAL